MMFLRILSSSISSWYARPWNGVPDPKVPLCTVGSTSSSAADNGFEEDISTSQIQMRDSIVPAFCILEIIRSLVRSFIYWKSHGAAGRLCTVPLLEVRIGKVFQHEALSSHQAINYIMPCIRLDTIWPNDPVINLDQLRHIKYFIKNKVSTSKYLKVRYFKVGFKVS